MIDQVNTEMIKVVARLNTNKITLNMNKTPIIVFKTAKKLISSSKSVLINNHPITQVTTTKFLRIIIDSSLSWHDHILAIKGKESRGILSKARCYFNYATLKTLYYSFIYPYLHYYHEIWGSTYATYLDPLIKLKKQAMRVITGSPRSCSTEPLFQEHLILPLKYLYPFSIQVFLYKLLNGLLPDVITTTFTITSDIHFLKKQISV